MERITLTAVPNSKEELRDFLDSMAWEALVDLVAAKCIPMRKTLLTSLELDATKRVSYVSKLSAYHELFAEIYQVAGFKSLPNKYRELFTGSETS